MLLIAVLTIIGLFVSEQDNSESYGWIFMKFENR